MALNNERECLGTHGLCWPLKGFSSPSTNNKTSVWALLGVVASNNEKASVWALYNFKSDGSMPVYGSFGFAGTTLVTWWRVWGAATGWLTW